MKQKLNVLDIAWVAVLECILLSGITYPTWARIAAACVLILSFVCDLTAKGE